MPPKRTGEPKEAEGQRILKLGKSNNIIQWTVECGLGTGGGWTDGPVKKCNAGKR
jgi:hypothetical protein